MEILVQTKKHYWHFKGFRLFRKVKSWDWERVQNMIDALHAYQTEQLDLDLDKTREYLKNVDADISRGAVEAEVATNRLRATQGSGWRSSIDMSLPAHQEPVLSKK